MSNVNLRRFVAGTGIFVLCLTTTLVLAPTARGGGGSQHGDDDGDRGGPEADDDVDDDDHDDGHHGGGRDDDDAGHHGGGHDDDDDDGHHGGGHDEDDDDEEILYVWAGDPARIRPDFIAVIDFDEDSDTYGQVLKTVEVPPPGNVGNEAHHCGLSADKNTLACGGLLSILYGQPEIFFFDVSDAENPVFIKAVDAPLSSVTDDFYPKSDGGFLVTMMGSASGGPNGKVVEFDADLNLVQEWPTVEPADYAFNPHGIGVREDLDLMVTSDFLNPLSTLNVVPGDLEFRSAVRVWDYDTRTILRKVDIPGAVGAMDVKMIPGDPEGRAITAGMMTGLVFTIDTATGVATQSFDCETIVPHVETDIDGGMVQLVAMPQSGDRLIFASFQAGQVGLLDITDRYNFTQLDVVDLGFNSGPHAIYTTEDDKRLVVTDYFLDQDDFGKVHFEGDHKVHVIEVKRNDLELDGRFTLDFDTAFPDGPARPHGMAFK